MVFGLISSVTNHIIGKNTVKSITSNGGGGGLLYSNLVGMTPIPSGASTFINLDSGYSARTDTSSSYTVSNSTAGYTYANGTYNTLTSGAFAGGYYSYYPFNNYTNNGDPSWSSTNNWSGGTNTNFSTSVTSVGTVYGPWIQIQLPYTSYLFSYAIRTRGTNGVPKAWYIVGSNDGTTWTVIDNQTNAISTTNTTTYNSFNTPTTAYSYYRMIIYQNDGTSYSSLIRFDLNGYLTGVPSSDFTTFTNITSQAYTVTKKISGLSTATYNNNSGGNNGSVAVNMVQTKMLYGTAQGLWYATSSNAGVTWSGLTLLQSATPSGNQGGSCQISSDGTKGLFYCNGNFLYYVNWTNTTPTISTISSAVSFSWGSISMTPNGLNAVFGGNGTSAYYTTWNASTSTYNTPGIFNYGSNLTVPHMAIGISSDGTTLMADNTGTSGSNLGYLTISSWSTGNTPVPTITTNWQPLGSGTNLNLNGGSLCFLGGNTTFSPSTYVLGFTVGAPIYIYKWNNSTKTLTYSFTAVASTGFWAFGVQPCGSGGNIIYFIENTSAGTTTGTMNISSITLTTS